VGSLQKRRGTYSQPFGGSSSHAIGVTLRKVHTAFAGENISLGNPPPWGKRDRLRGLLGYPGGTGVFFYQQDPRFGLKGELCGAFKPIHRRTKGLTGIIRGAFRGLCGCAQHISPPPGW